ncbi:hypothetical protein O2V13_004766 [Vibrio parahaemolyticus]|nr:hypothetical protein [Vibrio parahaemolyticus]EHH1097282.1 hypothetical protein [Vibrio parahaemolyticus]EHR1137081.1 hypothetical protein [Vibrio parahaemolyticus]EKG2489510.1 hypothetical protein [Vibrio parahaemolyticus]ELA9350069.1 hypothetical protein [Vibrio parahaemolyticus]
MEVSSSAISGALKAGVQVVSAQKRPVLDVYHRIHNLKHPRRDITSHDDPSLVVGTTSRQQVFISFTLTNIGGERAENIKLTIGGNMIRPEPMKDLVQFLKMYTRKCHRLTLYTCSVLTNSTLTGNWTLNPNKNT